MSRLPPLLLTASLLAWGAANERWVPGMVCALLIQGAEWSRLRWDFAERAALVAWRLTVLFLTIAMVLVVMEPGPRITTMERVFTWLPVVLMPLQFVQSFGTLGSLSLGTFSMMVRRRQQHAEKFGLPFRDLRFCFDNVFFCATLLAACLGRGARGDWFYPVLVALVAWAIVARIGRGRRGLGLATAFALMAAAVAGLGGQMGLAVLYQKLISGGSGGSQNSRDPNLLTKVTSLGDMGTLKQSSEIFWRLRPERGPLPGLLRLTSYNVYYPGDSPDWVAILPEAAGTMANDFRRDQVKTETDPLRPDDKNGTYWICPPELPDRSVAMDSALPRFRLRGALNDEFVLLPVPAEAASMSEFVVNAVERNSFGTFQVQRIQPVCDARMLWGEGFRSERPPWISVKDSRSKHSRRHPGDDHEEQRKRETGWYPDLDIPWEEAEVIERVATELGLYAGTVEEKIAKLRVFFTRDFRYSKYNSVVKALSEWRAKNPAVDHYVLEQRTDGSHPTLLSVFLEQEKTGHCEFFASAAALLLREVGVPTRYVTGFAVVERNPRTGEAILRGTHAHAWCRAWDEENNRWLDVDLTPASWTAEEIPRPTRFQALRDWFQLLREDILIWRDKPGHMMFLAICLLTPTALGLAYVAHRLWRSRRRLEASKGRQGTVVHKVTPLSLLEKPARRILGERPPGKPLGTWMQPLGQRLGNPALLVEALSLHHRLRFDPAEEGRSLEARLQSLVTEIRKQLAAK